MVLECRSAGERLLAVGGHYRFSGATACGRITAPAPMFNDDFGTPLRVVPRTPGRRRDGDLNLLPGRDDQETEAQQTAELAHSWVAFAATPAPGGADR